MVPSRAPEWLIWVSLIHLEKEMQLYILEDAWEKGKERVKERDEKGEREAWATAVEFVSQAYILSMYKPGLWFLQNYNWF